MQWTNRRQSDNVEDQRGIGGVLPLGGVGTLILAVVIYFMGGNPFSVLNGTPSSPNSGSPTTSISRGGGSAGAGQNDSAKKFVSVVLGDTEDVWGKIFQQSGKRYRNPKLVLFSGQVRSACGIADTSAGPFYCPRDEKVYLDPNFFQEMRSKYGAPGDFAAAYVIAHEVGHHVQNQLGLTNQVQAAEARSSERGANQLSVRTELQADYYAGVFAHYEKQYFDPGDLEEALNAAGAVGDDRLQQQTRGYVTPDSFTHGTSAQRMEWFKKGFESGDPNGGKALFSD